MLCETENGRVVLIFEEADCEPLVGNYSLWDAVVFEAACMEMPHALLNREINNNH